MAKMYPDTTALFPSPLILHTEQPCNVRLWWSRGAILCSNLYDADFC